MNHPDLPPQAKPTVPSAPEVGGEVAGSTAEAGGVGEAWRRLRESEARLRATLDSALDAVVSIDSSGHLIYFNPAAEQMFGWAGHEVLGRLMGDVLVPAQHRDAHRHGLARFVDTRETRILNRRIEITALRRDGSEFPVELAITSIRQNDADLFTAYIRDVTARKQMEEDIRRLAFYDTLTRLPNRRLIYDRLSQAMVASKRHGCYGAVMFLDLDNFKPLNDAHGHAVGDLLLIEAANRLCACVRGIDTVARFGGDEFVVILGDLDTDRAASMALADTVAEKILRALAQPYTLTSCQSGSLDQAVVHQCSASIGVVMFLNQDASQEDLLKWADAAMYRAKQAGRNLACHHDKDLA